jgi:sec-independent protein translocase protein TatA
MFKRVSHLVDNSRARVSAQPPLILALVVTHPATKYNCVQEEEKEIDMIPGVNLGLPEILIIAVIVILLFGVGRIGKIGGELGKGIREFRSAVKEGENPEDPANPTKKDDANKTAA